MNRKIFIMIAASLLTAIPVFGVPPLTEFPKGFTYHGEAGGLYGNGKNDVPAELTARALIASRQVLPRNATGKPTTDGRIGLLVIGMSNTHQKAAAWQTLLVSQPANSSLTLVDGAIGGMDASDWAEPEKRMRQEEASPWEQLNDRLNKAKLNAAQVQVVWLHQALRKPSRFGPYPAPADALAGQLTAITGQIATRFPNVHLIFLSSRAYAGYATSDLNPEPHAYESAFAVRRVVLAAKAESPVLLWGPYLWADGATPRADGLKWEPADFAPRDGTHLSPTGAAKAANVIDTFFRHSPFSSDWYPIKPTP